jgi:hypothetical protein
MSRLEVARALSLPRDDTVYGKVAGRHGRFFYDHVHDLDKGCGWDFINKAVS